MKRVLLLLLFGAFAFMSCQKALVGLTEDTPPDVSSSPSVMKNDDVIYPTGVNENEYWINDTTCVGLLGNSWDYHIIQNCMDFPVVMSITRSYGVVDIYSISPGESIRLKGDGLDSGNSFYSADNKGVILDFGTFGTLDWQINSNGETIIWVENHPGWYNYFLNSLEYIEKDYELKEWHPFEEFGWDKELYHEYIFAYPVYMFHILIDEKLMGFLSVTE